MAWLNDQERQADIVLFVATPEAGAWSHAALRQADQAVFVAQSVRYTPPSEIEQAALSILPEAQRRLVLIHPHRMQKATGTARWLVSRPVFPAPPCRPDRGWRRHGAAGPVSGRSRGLRAGAVGRGRLRCRAWWGVWRAMEEAGLPIDIVGGTSVGSAMAGAIALGVPALEIGPRVERIFVRSGAMRRVTVPKYAFLDHKVLDAALREHYGTDPIEDLWLPLLWPSAPIFRRWRNDVLRRGPLWEAVRASSAIPRHPAGLSSPRRGEMLVDGGLHRQHAVSRHARA